MHHQKYISNILYQLKIFIRTNINHQKNIHNTFFLFKNFVKNINLNLNRFNLCLRSKITEFRKLGRFFFLKLT